MRFTILTLFMAATAATAANVTPDIMGAFQRFQKKYGKQYSGEEFGKRIGYFAENMEKVNQQNAEHILVGGKAVFGITRFSDLSKDEFASMYLNYVPSNTTKARTTPVSKGANADSIDWRTQGAVTPVKDQGQCGSCWAFSATDAIESYGKLSGKYPLQVLSTQQITSCDQVDQGCNGGNTETAYNYVLKAGGIELDSDYPYTSGGGDSGMCKFDSSKVNTKITGYTSVAKGEANLKTALNSGPVSICLAAEAFQSYTGGILKVCRGQTDHCVQAVGYDDSQNYWLVRNSWATTWGEQGYIRIEQGKDLCHIADDVTFPTFLPQPPTFA